MNTVPPSTSVHSAATDRPRPPAREPLRPLLYRRLSAALYRRSPRFAQHSARVGPEQVLPHPPLVDLLAVWLAQRLPDRAVARLGPAGLFRCAKLITAGLRPLAWAAGLMFWLARAGWRMTRRLRGLIRSRRSAAERSAFDARPPVGNAGQLLGGVVLFRGFQYADNRLTCWFQRVRPCANACQIFIHLYPADPEVAAALEPLGRISRDHNPQIPLAEWPLRRAYRDQTCLNDLPAGDYRVEVGLFDLTAHQRLCCFENGRSAIELGWIRVARPAGAASLDAAPDPSGRAATPEANPVQHHSDRAAARPAESAAHLTGSRHAGR